MDVDIVSKRWRWQYSNKYFFSKLIVIHNDYNILLILYCSLYSFANQTSIDEIRIIVTRLSLSEYWYGIEFVYR